MLRCVCWLCVLLGFACQSGEPSGVELFEKYFEVYPIALSEEMLNTEPLLRPAYDAYQEEDFETVVKVAGDFTRDVRRLPLSMMALSMGYIKMDSLDAADATLAVLEAHPDIGDESTWYRALIRVKRGQFDDATPLLEYARRNYDEAMEAQVSALSTDLQQR